MFNSLRQNLLFASSKRFESLLSFTPKCIEKLKSLGNEDGYLRIAVEGGGCSGFQYVYKLDKSINPDDHLVKESPDVCVVIDSDSVEFVKNSVLDYQDELIRSGFKITKNPQSEKGCSCGVSFAVRLD